MSYFYLKPAKGDVPIHLLEEIVVRRLEYLQNVSKENRLLYNEYVIEGSVYDNVGHFVLCIVSSVLKNKDFTQFLLTSEVSLFNQRIALLSTYDLRCFAKKLVQIIRKLNTTILYILPLQQLCRNLTLKNICNHICSSQHTDDCESYSLKVHFKHCLTFVAKRQVEMSKGLASIPCSKWIQYLVLLFKKGLLHRIRQSQQYLNEYDPRIEQLLMIVKKHFSLPVDSNTKLLRSKDVDKFTQYFPPCMVNLHQCLRSRHRLSHDQRFYYGLFLKDIGMPVDEAIDFWKDEYCQVPTVGHRCTHSWEKDEKKFVYGIRHWYGLEGKKTNYASTNCQKMQSMDHSCHEGGCPFKSFDDANMIQALQINVADPLLSQIFQLKREEMYTSACLLFLKSTYKTELSSDSINTSFSPVKYFTIAYENSLG